MNYYVFPALRQRDQISYLRRVKKDDIGHIIFRLTPEEIVNKVCNYYNITSEELFSRCRKREYVEPRQIAQTLIKRHTTLSLNKIGEMFNRDHTTVIASKVKVADMMDTEEDFRQRVNEIQNSLLD